MASPDTWTLDLTDLRESEIAKILAISELLGVSNGSLYELLRRYSSMIEGAIKEAPFQKGDRVQLLTDPVIGPGSGWLGAKHFLVKGAKATVRCVQLNSNGWRIGLMFDKDSHVDINGKEHLRDASDRGVYFFPANQVGRADAARKTRKAK